MPGPAMMTPKVESVAPDQFDLKTGTLIIGAGACGLVAALSASFTPSEVALGPRRIPQTAYASGSIGTSDTIRIQRFLGVGARWTAVGRPWRASWGPLGPPVTSCAGTPATMVGTSGPDVITGTPGRDVISALGGADLIYGNTDSDTILSAVPSSRPALNWTSNPIAWPRFRVLAVHRKRQLIFSGSPMVSTRCMAACRLWRPGPTWPIGR